MNYITLMFWWFPWHGEGSCLKAGTAVWWVSNHFYIGSEAWSHKPNGKQGWQLCLRIVLQHCRHKELERQIRRTLSRVVRHDDGNLGRRSHWGLCSGCILGRLAGWVLFLFHQGARRHVGLNKMSIGTQGLSQHPQAVHGMSPAQAMGKVLSKVFRRVIGIAVCWNEVAWNTARSAIYGALPLGWTPHRPSCYTRFFAANPNYCWILLVNHYPNPWHFLTNLISLRVRKLHPQPIIHLDSAPSAMPTAALPAWVILKNVPELYSVFQCFHAWIILNHAKSRWFTAKNYEKETPIYLKIYMERHETATFDVKSGIQCVKVNSEF